MRFFVFAIFLLPNLLFAQAEVIFESTLYVEDAMGNRDSVEFGYAINEEWDVFNPDLGEVPIYEPFDSVLEMRATSWTNYNGFGDLGPLSKRIITAVTEEVYDEIEECYILQGHAGFMVHAKYLPVTFSWDHEAFSSVICRRAATFSTHIVGTVFDNWYQDSSALSGSVCASVNDSYVTDFPDLSDVVHGLEIEKDIEIEGGQVKAVRGMVLAYTVSPWLPTWCNTDTTLISATREIIEEELELYPNPVSELLYIGMDAAETFLIVDISGRVMMEESGSPVDVSLLPSGIYFIKTRNRKAARFVKE